MRHKYGTQRKTGNPIPLGLFEHSYWNPIGTFRQSWTPSLHPKSECHAAEMSCDTTQNGTYHCISSTIRAIMAYTGYIPSHPDFSESQAAALILLFVTTTADQQAVGMRVSPLQRHPSEKISYSINFFPLLLYRYLINGGISHSSLCCTNPLHLYITRL